MSCRVQIKCRKCKSVFPEKEIKIVHGKDMCAGCRAEMKVVVEKKAEDGIGTDDKSSSEQKEDGQEDSLVSQSIKWVQMVIA